MSDVPRKGGHKGGTMNTVWEKMDFFFDNLKYKIFYFKQSFILAYKTTKDPSPENVLYQMLTRMGIHLRLNGCCENSKAESRNVWHARKLLKQRKFDEFVEYSKLHMKCWWD